MNFSRGLRAFSWSYVLLQLSNTSSLPFFSVLLGIPKTHYWNKLVLWTICPIALAIHYIWLASTFVELIERVGIRIYLPTVGILEYILINNHIWKTLITTAWDSLTDQTFVYRVIWILLLLTLTAVHEGLPLSLDWRINWQSTDNHIKSGGYTYASARHCLAIVDPSDRENRRISTQENQRPKWDDREQH